MLKNKLLPMVLNKVTIGLKKTKRVISLLTKAPTIFSIGFSLADAMVRSPKKKLHWSYG